MSNSSPRPPQRPANRHSDKGGKTSPAVEATEGQPVVTSGGTAQPSVARPAAGGPVDAAHRIGDYLIVKKIGEGGMGAVYLAEDLRLHRKVAIKTMRPEAAAHDVHRQRFLREARAAAAVEHDHIVPILHVAEAQDGTPFIVMPFLQGESLDDRLDRTPVASLELLLKVAADVADGLAAAHARGLVHRDIKPANIWLEFDPAAAGREVRRCKILDFGLARVAEDEDDQLTAFGTILGTPAYMAPEQARGAKVDHLADLYSLGSTLYRAATGRPPFAAPNKMALLYAVSHADPIPILELNPFAPPAVAALIDRLMRKEPLGRPQSAHEIVAAARRLIADAEARRRAGAPAEGSQPLSADEPDRPEPPHPKRRPRLLAELAEGDAAPPRTQAHEKPRQVMTRPADRPAPPLPPVAPRRVRAGLVLDEPTPPKEPRLTPVTADVDEQEIERIRAARQQQLRSCLFALATGSILAAALALIALAALEPYTPWAIVLVGVVSAAGIITCMLTIRYYLLGSRSDADQ